MTDTRPAPDSAFNRWFAKDDPHTIHSDGNKARKDYCWRGWQAALLSETGTPQVCACIGDCKVGDICRRYAPTRDAVLDEVAAYVETWRSPANPAGRRAKLAVDIRNLKSAPTPNITNADDCEVCGATCNQGETLTSCGGLKCPFPRADQRREP